MNRGEPIMTKPNKIPGSDEAWDSGELGGDAEHAQPIRENLEKEIDASLEMHLISIRLQKSLIEDFKAIAQLNAIGYQTLMRQILKRFVECEKKKILRETFALREAAARSESDVSDEKPKKRKAVG
jgi:uncharacterized protein (DUF4415 family)